MASDDFEVYIEKGEEKLDKEDYEGALKCFDKALEIDSSDLMANYYKGLIFSDLDELDKALETFNYVLKLDPEFNEVYYDKALVLCYLEDFNKAENCIDKYLESEPSDPDGLNLKGLIFLESGQNHLSINYFNKALKVEPNHFFALKNKAEALIQLDKLDEAIDCINKAITIDNQDSALLCQKGKAIALKGQIPAALQFYDEALAIDPDNTEIMWWKALAFCDDGKNEYAMDLLDVALNIDPDNLTLLETKGDLLREFNKPEDAFKIFISISELYPEYPNVWLKIGNVFKDLEKDDDSITAYKNFVEIVRKNKYTDLYQKAKRVSEYINWINETGEMVTFSPRENPQYWQWSTKSEYFLEDDGAEREVLEPGTSLDPGRWWTCHKDTQAGDLVLLYRAGKKGGKTFQDIKYLIMARSDAYPLDDIEDAVEKGWEYGCDFLPVYKFKNSLKLDEMRNNPYLEGWNALNGLFHRIAYKTEEKYWKYLTDQLVEKNPDYGNFLNSFDREKIIAEIRTEKEVEEKLEQNISVLKNLGYDLEVKSRQERCTGDEGVIDLLCKDKNEGNYVVIELKINKANRNTFGQISGYIGWVMEHKVTEKDVKGIVISRGYDKKFRSALKTNSNIAHLELSDILAGLDMKLV